MATHQPDPDVHPESPAGGTLTSFPFRLSPLFSNQLAELQSHLPWAQEEAQQKNSRHAWLSGRGMPPPPSRCGHTSPGRCRDLSWAAQPLGSSPAEVAAQGGGESPGCPAQGSLVRQLISSALCSEGPSNPPIVRMASWQKTHTPHPEPAWPRLYLQEVTVSEVKPHLDTDHRPRHQPVA